MNPSKFELPGSDLLRQSKNLFGEKKEPPKPSRDVLVKAPGGGGGRTARKPKPELENSDPEPLDIPLQSEPSEEKPKDPEAKLSEPEWKASTTRFQEEAQVSVKLKLPAGKEHLTRVEAELHAKTASGSEVVSKAEGHADASGMARFVLPVYYPTQYAEQAVEYFLVFKHRLTKALETIDVPRTVTEVALKAADYSLVTGIGFAKNSSFIGPDSAQDLKKLEEKFNEWQKKFPKGQIVVYGHAETDEKDPKSLSERRAKSAFAFISNDVGAWEEISKAEAWGLEIYQMLLKDTGHDPGKPDGHDGPKTQAAFKAFQKQSGIPQSGQADGATRKALFSAYMRGKHDIKVDASRFRTVDGHPWMGCGFRNRVESKDGAHVENRRVVFLLIDECKSFPVHFPCKDGNDTTCERKCQVGGKRSGPGIKCWFYDQLVREDKKALSDPGKTSDELDELMSRSSLNAKEISRARTLIGKRADNLKPDYYTRLQSKVKYKSQRDNNQSGDVADRMCNLTSLAMALEYLGISNPDSGKQFEDYLEKVRSDKGYPPRTDSQTWGKLAGEFSVEMVSINLMTSDSETLKSKLKPEIEKGRGVVISAFSSESGKGHIVRLQSVAEKGLIVDDPFGKLNNFKQRENGGSGYKGTANTRSSDSHLGEDNLWTWEDIGNTIIKYADAFFKKE